MIIVLLKFACSSINSTWKSIYLSICLQFQYLAFVCKGERHDHHGFDHFVERVLSKQAFLQGLKSTVMQSFNGIIRGRM